MNILTLSRPSSSTPILAWIMLLVLSLIWGSSFILIKKGLLHLSSEEVGSLRISAAFIFLIPFASTQFGKIKRNDWKYLISVGLMGSLIPSFLFAVAQTQLQSSLTGVLNALTPIFVILMGLIFYRQKYSGRVFLGVAVGFAGTAILILSGEDGMEFNAYGLLIILATILYAGNLNLIKHHLGHLHALTITSVSIVIVGPLAMFYLFAFTEFGPKLFEGGPVALSIFYIVLLGVLGTAIALLIFNRIVQLTNPVFTSSVTYIIPLVAIAWGLLDGEVLTTGHMLGILAIVVGVYIANRPSRSEIKSD